MSSAVPIIKSMLDDDLYKFTMCQAVCQCYPHAQAIYNFINRGGTPFPDGFKDNLYNEIEMLGGLSLLHSESRWLAENHPFLTPVFIDFLKGYRYQPEEVSVSQGDDGQLHLMVEGPWYRTILWEVKLMAIISELYFRMTGVDYNQKEVDAITLEKAQQLKEYRVHYADLGTRRRLSATHHDHTIGLHAATSAYSFIGTSNLYLAKKRNIRSMGTQGHEWFMFHAAKYGYKEANKMALRKWVDVYHGNLGIALSDTFTTPTFFQAFGSKYAKLFDGVRHDSGDPMVFAHRVHAHYRELGIDPSSKTIVFSDGLDPETAIQLKTKCQDLGIKCSFGIGTNLTNDIPGVKPLNMVIKMSHCRPYGESEWLPVVKLSDVEGKHTGAPEEIKLCKQSLRI